MLINDSYDRNKPYTDEYVGASIVIWTHLS